MAQRRAGRRATGAIPRSPWLLALLAPAFLMGAVVGRGGLLFHSHGHASLHAHLVPEADSRSDNGHDARHDAEHERDFHGGEEDAPPAGHDGPDAPAILLRFASPVVVRVLQPFDATHLLTVCLHVERWIPSHVPRELVTDPGPRERSPLRARRSGVAALLTTSHALLI